MSTGYNAGLQEEWAKIATNKRVQAALLKLCPWSRELCLATTRSFAFQASSFHSGTETGSNKRQACGILDHGIFQLHVSDGANHDKHLAGLIHPAGD